MLYKLHVDSTFNTFTYLQMKLQYRNNNNKIYYSNSYD